MPQPPRSSIAPDLPPVIGHRGAAGSAPENTLASFQRAAELGLSWVECDLRLTADGQAALLHDATLDRTTNGRGLLAGATTRRLAELDAGSWFGGGFARERVPTLEQALECWQRHGLSANLELKTEDGSAEPLTRAVAAVLASAPFSGALLLSSFEPPALIASVIHLPELPRGLLVEDLTEENLERARSLGCISIHASAASLTAERVKDARSRGLVVMAYTVNEPEPARTLWSWGVKSVFSDFPERLSILGGCARPLAPGPRG